MSWLWSKIIGKPNYAQEIEHKRKVLQCSREKLQVEVETQEQLEHTITQYKKHLNDLREREEYVQSRRVDLIKDVELQKREYEEKGEKDEEFERKCANTEQYLNVELIQQIETIREKMKTYEKLIDKLENRINELSEVRRETERLSYSLQEEIDQLESLQRSSTTTGNADEEDSRMLIRLEEASMDNVDAVPVDSMISLDHPQQHTTITFRDNV